MAAKLRWMDDIMTFPHLGIVQTNERSVRSDPRGRVLELEAPNRRRKRNENSKEGRKKVFKSSFDDSRFPGLKPNHACRIFWVKLSSSPARKSS